MKLMVQLLRLFNIVMLISAEPSDYETDLSNKPTCRISGTTYEKVKRYADIISETAKYLKSICYEKTFKGDSWQYQWNKIFQYIDTNSSRQIWRINSKLEMQKNSNYWIGGTGAYILDMVAKTPVKEIHLLMGTALRTPDSFSFTRNCSVINDWWKSKKGCILSKVIFKYAQAY